MTQGYRHTAFSPSRAGGKSLVCHFLVRKASPLLLGWGWSALRHSSMRRCGWSLQQLSSEILKKKGRTSTLNMGKVWSSLWGNLKCSSSCIRACSCTQKTSAFLEGDDLREGEKISHPWKASSSCSQQFKWEPFKYTAVDLSLSLKEDDQAALGEMSCTTYQSLKLWS